VSIYVLLDLLTCPPGYGGLNNRKKRTMLTKEAKIKLEIAKKELDGARMKLNKADKSIDNKEMVISIPNVCGTEISEEFIKGMVNRMIVSFFKYGLVEEGYGKDGSMDAIESLKLRLKAFEEGNEEKGLLKGNVEMLMDVANFAMIGFMYPREGEYFEGTDSNKSVGRVTKQGIATQRSNN
jgi:hypothetical protein